MAFASVTTKVDTGIMTRRIIQVMSGGVGTGDVIDLEMLPYCSAHVVLTSGTAVTSITVKVANDGITTVGSGPPLVLTNGVQIGATLTTMPNIFPLTIGAMIATGPGAAFGAPITVAYRFVQFTLVGAGDATTVVTVTIEAMGSRG